MDYITNTGGRRREADRTNKWKAQRVVAPVNVDGQFLITEFGTSQRTRGLLPSLNMKMCVVKQDAVEVKDDALESHSSLAGKDTLPLGAWDLRRTASREHVDARSISLLNEGVGRSTRLAKTSEPSKYRIPGSISAAIAAHGSPLKVKTPRGCSSCALVTQSISRRLDRVRSAATPHVEQ